MAPPKPSQRGKFRPKKPQKKVSKPTTPATGSTESSAPSSSPPAPVKSSNHIEGSSIKRNNSSFEARGGRGRGRGGRGMGGRGRIPSGTVFFTGEEKKAAPTKGSTNKTTTSTGTSRTSKKRDSKNVRDSMDTSTEEVVGQLDTAIGGSENIKKESILESGTDDHKEAERPLDFSEVPTGLNISAGCIYDSDSSDETSSRISKSTSLIPPLELPFSTKSVNTRIQPDKTNSSYFGEQNYEDYSESTQSPFAVRNQSEDSRQENNSWFLVQLPSRLPPMQKDMSHHKNEESELEEGDRNDPSASSSTIDHSNLSEVAVPPVTTNCFDNSLHKNAPGRIGKILVYKSGKTVLVMDGPDDTVRSNL